MNINREKFLSALVAVSLTTAAACGEEPVEEPEPQETSGAEEVIVPEPEPEPEPAPEPPATFEPEVEPAPTTE